MDAREGKTMLDDVQSNSSELILSDPEILFYETVESESIVIIPPYKRKKMNPQKEAQETEVSIYTKNTVGKRGRPKVSPIPKLEDAVQKRGGPPGTQIITVKHNIEDKLKDISNVYSTGQKRSTKEMTKSSISKGDKENDDRDENFTSILFSPLMNDSPEWETISDNETEDSAVISSEENMTSSEFSKMWDNNGIKLQFLGTSEFPDFPLFHAPTSKVIHAIEIEEGSQMSSSPFKSYHPSEIYLMSDDMDSLF